MSQFYPQDGFQYPQANKPPLGPQQPGAGSGPYQTGFPPAGQPQPSGGFTSDSFKSMRDFRLRPRSDTAQELRPFGVTIAAIAVAVTGCLYLLMVQLGLCGLSFISSLINQLSTTPIVGTAASQASAALGIDSFILVILFYSALGIAHLYMARGLWQLQRWAYWGVVGVEGFTILVQLFTLGSSHNGGIFFSSVYIPVLIAGYLLVVGQVRKTFQVPF